MSREMPARSPGWTGSSAIPTPRVVYERAKEKVEAKPYQFFIPDPLEIPFRDHYNTQPCDNKYHEKPGKGVIENTPLID